MATNYVLKPFTINLNDLAYLLDQVNFLPMFDSSGERAHRPFDGST